MGFFNQILLFLQFLGVATIASLHLLLGGTTSVLTTLPAPTMRQTTTTSFIVSTTTAPTASAATSSKKETPSKPVQKTIAVIPTATSTSLPASQPLIATESAEEVNTNTRTALVNILCTTGAGGYFNPISGSGVIIDSRGVVLTNAHVGQFFLLRDYPTQDNINCVLRTGSPAQATYTAKLLYLPPVWITANASEINMSHASGTGQNDYAFLLITGSTNPGLTLPASFPVLAMTANAPDIGDQMLLAAYPAGFLDGETIQMNLYITSAIAAVQDLYTFDDPTHVDAINVGGTVVSQSGASGGAVVRLDDGSLVGIISTDTASSTTAGRELDAITISHINRGLVSEGQGGIVPLLTGDLTSKATAFASTTALTETQQLEDVLNKQ